MAMSRKCVAGLSGCRYCGGLPELKRIRAHIVTTERGHSIGRSFYIRCEQCHAATPTYDVLASAKFAWSNGNVFRPIKGVQNA